MKKQDSIKEKEQLAKALKQDSEIFRKAANRLNRVQYTDNALKIAASILGVTATDFDKEPHLFNMKNGVFDFALRQFRPHSRQDRFKKQASFEYDEQADCPKFVEFINLIFLHDEKLIAWILKQLAICLTGNTPKQIVYFGYGRGKNGKTTLMIVLAMLLNDYFLTLDIESFLTNRKNTVNYDDAQSYGKRLILADEIPKGRHLDEAKVKTWTGGGERKARDIYEKSITFSPTDKLWITTNDKPIIKGTDDGIWRRMKLIPFNHQFDKPRDKDEVTAELRAELAGIFNLLVTAYYTEPEEPEAVKMATEEYKSESDTLSEYISECCTTRKIDQCTLKDLFANYSQWCKESNYKYFGKQDFGKELEKKDFEKAELSGHMVVFKGIALKNENYSTQSDEKPVF